MGNLPTIGAKVGRIAHPTGEGMHTLFDQALDELRPVLAGMNKGQVDAACDAIAGAGRVVTFGCGREKLMLNGFAMRLFHLGVDVAVAGDVTTPPVGEGDLLIASAGPGDLATVTAMMGRARSAGARVVMITAEPEAASAALADDLLVIPAQTMARDQGDGAETVLPMGSMFEGAMFVLFEVMVLMLREKLGVSAEDMRARHTNLE